MNNGGLRLLIAVHHFPPSYLGGAEWQAYRIARWLRENGHDARVICVESDTCGGAGQLGHKDDVYDGIPIRRLFFNLSLSPDPFRWSFRNPLIEQHLTAYLASFRPDLVHLISGYLISGSVISVAQSLAIPTVLMPMDFWFLCPRITLLRPGGSVCEVPKDLAECVLCLCQKKRRYRLMACLTAGLSNRFLRRLWKVPTALKWMGQGDTLAALQERRTYLRRVFAMADVVLSNSLFLKEMLTAQGFHPARFVQLRQGLDTTRWEASSENKKRTSSHLRVGYIGQIAKHKGVDVLVRAFKRLRTQGPAPRLLLYGETERHPRFVRHLRRLVDGDGNIEFAGTFENNQILKVHSELDVLVVPSLWYENSPNVILEASAAGTPVIASNMGGMAELVQHGVNGLCFTPGDGDDLARQLQFIVDEPSTLNDLKQGISCVKTIQEEMTELIQVYRSVARDDRT